MFWEQMSGVIVRRHPRRLLRGPICLISQGRLDEPARLSTDYRIPEPVNSCENSQNDSALSRDTATVAVVHLLR